jgi:hypothetical protein
VERGVQPDGKRIITASADKTARLWVAEKPANLDRWHAYQRCLAMGVTKVFIPVREGARHRGYHRGRLCVNQLSICCSLGLGFSGI